MRPLTLPIALCLLLLSACSTLQQSAPARIDPPPVALVTACSRPDSLPEGATAQDLAEWTVGWMGAYGCERSKRAALIEAWPR